MFLLDTNIFIQCHNYNPPTVFKSLWNWFETNDQNATSIMAVYDEIRIKNDDLHSLMRDFKKRGFFIDNTTKDIQENYTSVVEHVCETYSDNPRRNGFLNGADGWLIATAMTYRCGIITFEKPQNSPANPKIPNVASHFRISCSDFFKFLHNHSVKF